MLKFYLLIEWFILQETIIFINLLTVLMKKALIEVENREEAKKIVRMYDIRH